jgi:hypothetical protein
MVSHPLPNGWDFFIWTISIYYTEKKCQSPKCFTGKEIQALSLPSLQAINWVLLQSCSKNSTFYVVEFNFWIIP